MPAAMVSNAGGVLTVTGSGLADRVAVTIDDTANQVIVQAGDALSSVTRVFPASSVTSLNINTAGGDDIVTTRLASDLTRALSVTVRLGDGNDQAALDFGRLKSHTIAANLNVFVDGQASATDLAASDVIRADFGDVNASSLSFTALAGGGADALTANLWGILRGTQAFFNLQGEGDNDVVDFYNDNGSWASALLSVNLNGGSGNDTVTLFYDDNMVGQHVFRVDGGSGNDLIDVQIHARAGSTGSLTLDVFGNTGADRMRTVLDVATPALRINRAFMDGGFDADFDTVLAGTTGNVQQAHFS